MGENQLTVNNLSSGVIPYGIYGFQNALDVLDHKETEKGGVVIFPTQKNAAVFLKEHAFFRGLFGWDNFLDDPVLMGRLPDHLGFFPPDAKCDYPRPISDADLIYIRQALAHIAGNEFSKSAVDDSITSVAKQNVFNPVENYLKSLSWDGTERLNLWMHYTYGAARSELNRQIGRKFLIAAVRRAVRPRYKFDSLLIIEGPKGIRKSTSLRVLFGDEYFTESPLKITDKEAAQSISGFWGVEYAELRGFREAASNSQKDWLSRQEDVFRKPYARKAVRSPRRFVMTATVNDDEYLKEAPGDRRFWPVRCLEDGEFDIDWLINSRDQLWAEAYHAATTTDEPTWLDEELMVELTRGQELRRESHIWEDHLSEFLDKKTSDEIKRGFHATELLYQALQLTADRQDRKATIELKHAMEALGWVQQIKKYGGRSARMYFKDPLKLN